MSSKKVQDSDGSFIETDDKAEADKFSATTDFLHGDGLLPVIDKNTRMFIETNGEVVATDPLGLSVSVLGLIGLIDGFISGDRELSITPQATISFADADPSNPRIDLLVLKTKVDGNGKKINDSKFLAEVVQGVPSPIPVRPTIPDSRILLACVTINAGATTIQDTDIEDSRVFVSDVQKSELQFRQRFSGIESELALKCDELNDLRNRIAALEAAPGGGVKPLTEVIPFTDADEDAAHGGTTAGSIVLRNGCLELASTVSPGIANLDDSFAGVGGTFDDPAQWDLTETTAVPGKISNGELCTFGGSARIPIDSAGVSFSNVTDHELHCDARFDNPDGGNISLQVFTGTQAGDFAASMINITSFGFLNGRASFEIVGLVGQNFATGSVTVVFPRNFGQPGTALQVRGIFDSVTGTVTAEVSDGTTTITNSNPVAGIISGFLLNGSVNAASNLSLIANQLNSQLPVCVQRVFMGTPEVRTFTSPGAMVTNKLGTLAGIVTAGVAGKSVVPAGTTLTVSVSDDNGVTFQALTSPSGDSYDFDGIGNDFRVKVEMATTDTSKSASLCEPLGVVDNVVRQADYIILKNKVNEIISAQPVSTGNWAAISQV